MSIFKKLFKKKESKTTEEFFKLPVSEIIRETDKAVTLVFEKPEVNFDFKAGQYLTLRAEIDGKQVRRAYSLCSCPSESELKVTVKEIEDGYFSKYVNNNLVVGDLLEVLPPMGRFYLEQKKELGRNIIGFAGGSGITPIFSILKTVLYEEPKSRFTLFYGNRSIDDIIFYEELKQLEKKFYGRFKVIHVFSEQPSVETPYSGFIDADKVSYFSKTYFDVIDDESLFYLCGPGNMTMNIETALTDLGIASHQIKKELFTAPQAEDNQKTKDSKKEGVVDYSKVAIKFLGQTHHLEYTNSNKTILDLCLENDIKVSFSCLNGVCSSCSCKVKEGTALMMQNFTLEKEEIAEGYTLSCQAKPTSQTVTLDFDDNRI